MFQGLLNFQFLNKNHIHGYIRSKIKLGLFYKNELVSLMIFRKIKNEYELIRFCSKLNINIINGANKLFKYFIDIYKPNIIITYVNRTWSQGNLYKKLGFKYKSKTQTNRYYIIDGIRNKLNSKKERKIYKIYDSGNLKFELKSQ